MNQTMNDVVVVGAGYAGTIAAIRMARSSSCRVTLVNGSDTFVERIRLHEWAAGRKPRQHTIVSLLRGTGATFKQGRVTAVDTARKKVVLEDGATLAYDRLVLATGSVTARRTTTHEHEFTLDSTEWMARLPQLAEQGGRVAVHGGGLTGIETAVELAERWPTLRVTLVSTHIGSELSDAARAHMQRVLQRHRVEMTTALDEVDLAIICTGFQAAPLPEGLALTTNARGHVVVDAALRSIDDDTIFVAGDLAVMQHRPPIAIPLGCKSALPMGAHVADNVIASLNARPLSPFDFQALGYCVSLGRKDGVVQWFSRDGQMQGVWTGRLAAYTKELICRFTMWNFTLERRGLASYTMYQRGNVLPAPQVQALTS